MDPDQLMMSQRLAALPTSDPAASFQYGQAPDMDQLVRKMRMRALIAQKMAPWRQMFAGARDNLAATLGQGADPTAVR